MRGGAAGVKDVSPGSFRTRIMSISLREIVKIVGIVTAIIRKGMVASVPKVAVYKAFLELWICLLEGLPVS